MDPEQNQYHFSFFKPSSDSARRNRNIVVQFILIWFVAIFGFQSLLKILGKPTPEPVFALFETSWEKIQTPNPEIADMQNVGQAALSVLGKVAIDPRHRMALDNGISWISYQIADSVQKKELVKRVTDFEKRASTIDDIRNEAYVAEKSALIPLLATLFRLHPDDVRGKIAPLEVKYALMESFGDENKDLFVEAMELYLVHNRSVLTDTRFLGFPFHYFYTAVFLLILFVGLCWLYCVRTDIFNKKYGIED